MVCKYFFNPEFITAFLMFGLGLHVANEIKCLLTGFPKSWWNTFYGTTKLIINHQNTCVVNTKKIKVLL